MKKKTRKILGKTKTEETLWEAVKRRSARWDSLFAYLLLFFAAMFFLGIFVVLITGFISTWIVPASPLTDIIIRIGCWMGVTGFCGFAITGARF